MSPTRFLITLLAGVAFLSAAVPSQSQRAHFQYVRTDENSDCLLYDKFHKLVFVTNSLLNRVDVLSSIDAHLVARISIPSPSGLDITPDGSRVIVGTNGRFNFDGGVNYFFVIDPVSLTIIDRITTDIPPNNFGQLDDNAVPDFPAALSNGKILFNDATAGSSGRELMLYDPSDGSFTPRFATALGFPGLVAKSADGSKVLIADVANSGNVVLYDANSDSFVATANFPGGIFVLLLAANSNGTQFLVNGSTVLDGHLHTIAQLNLPRGQIYSASYSPDGTKMYLRRIRQTTQSISGGGTVTYSDDVITVVDASTFAVLGDVPAASITPGIVPAWRPGIVDENGRVFELEDRGVSLTDASAPSSQLPVHSQGLAIPTAAQPSSGSATAPAAITVNGRGFTSGDSISFGSVAGSGTTITSANSLQVVPPPSMVAGPVDLTLQSPDGWDYLAPQAYSYGPHMLYQDVNAGTAAGGTAVHLIGYGFGSDKNGITVTVGGQAATVTSVVGSALISPFSLPINHIYFTTPPGTLGDADIVVTTPFGSTTVSSGFEYLSFQPSGLSVIADQILLDEQRRQIFVSNIAGSNVRVLSQDTLQKLNDIVTPNTTNGLAITPDDKYLLATSVSGSSLYRINLDNISEVQTFPALAPLSISLGEFAPFRVVATNSNIAFVSNEAIDGTTNGLLARLNYIDGGVTRIGEQTPGFGTCCVAIVATPDGDNVFYGGWQWQAASDRFTPLPLDAMDAIDMSVSSDGNVLLDRLHTYDVPKAKLATRSIYFDLFDQTQNDFAGVQMDAGGALLFRPVDQTIRLYDVNTGNLLKTIGLPCSIDGATISNLAVDKASKNLYVVCTAGVLAIHLNQVPLSIGEIEPEEGLPQGGESLTIHGSGFVSGATVSMGNQVLATTFVDSNTLQTIAPAGQIGAASVTVTLPDQVTYTFPASYHYVSGNPVPTISAVSPQQPLVVPINTLTVTGSNFMRSSQVQADGVTLQSTFVNSTKIIATNGFAVAGQRQVTVVNPGPGGGASNAVAVNFLNQTPAVTSLNPNLVVAGSNGFVLIVGGEGFYRGSQVLWNGSPRNTRYVSYSELDADITAADIATPGNRQVTVTSPSPGGGTSLAAAFTIGDGLPALTMRLNPGAGSVILFDNDTFQVLLQNAGTGPLQVSNVSSDNPQFSVIGTSNCVGISIPVGSDCSLTIQFAPTQVGALAANIALRDNTKSGSDTFAVTGTGVASLLSFSPASLDFGTQLVGVTTSKIVTVTNTGISSLNFASIGTSAAQFAETNSCGSTIAANASCQITVKFDAATVAQFGANLGVTDSVQGAHLIPLTGTTLDFSIQPRNNAITVARGQAASSSILVSTLGAGDLGQAVTLSCSGLPTAASCSFASPTASPGTGNITVGFTISTAGQSASAHRQTLWTSAVFAMLMPFALMIARKNPRSVLLFVIASVLLQVSCGGGGGSGTSASSTPVGPTSPSGTPSGSYTIQVNGAVGSLQHSATVTLTVQ